jgi:A/G-specific adenine glycosylase
MLGWPGSDWSASPTPAPPLTANWHMLPEEVLHSFTHFHLRLRVMVAQVGFDTPPETGEFTPLQDFNPTDLPTVMRKVFDLTHDALENMVYV